MAVVGWEKTFYLTREDNVIFFVCAVVFDPDLECPVSFSFNISFTTADGTAGIYMKTNNVPLHIAFMSASQLLKRVQVAS